MEKGLWLSSALDSETAMYRFKQLIGPKLSLRSYNAQVGEILAGVKVMNKVIGLGMPIRQAVNCRPAGGERPSNFGFDQQGRWRHHG